VRTALLFLLFIGVARADLATPVPSPAGDYTVLNVGSGGDSHFEIRDRHGATLLSALQQQFLSDPVSRAALTAIWSPDGRSVAIGIRLGKYIEDTCVYSFRGGSFVSIPLNAFEADSKVVPIQWHGSRDLIVTVAGSYGGKADHPIFTRRCTFRLHPTKPEFEKVYESKPSSS
jgi:hypothetical protein